MRNYEVNEYDFGTVISYKENGVLYSFTADPANSDYAEYLRFTAWVEAGNNPDEFWTQATEMGEE
jgi:hypothetical protein